MELKEVVQVSGKPGLFKIVAHGKNNLIVESLDAAKTRTAVSATQRFSILDDIAMFTNGDDVSLRQVMLNLHEKAEAGLALPDGKADDKALKAWMEQVVPDFDKERVHTSDIKKLANWYVILKPILDFEELKKAKDEDENAVDELGNKKHQPKLDKVDKPMHVNTKAINTTKMTTRKTGGS